MHFECVSLMTAMLYLIRFDVLVSSCCALSSTSSMIPSDTFCVFDHVIECESGDVATSGSHYSDDVT